MINSLIITTFTAITFYIVGCSNTYSVPSQSKVIIQKEKLATYNPKNFSKEREVSKATKIRNEDQLIIKAIFLEEQHYFQESNKYYAKLYELTQRDEYLIKEVTTAHFANIPSKNIDALQLYTEEHPNNIQAQRLLLSFLLKEKKYEKAKVAGEKLTSHSSEPVDFELAANPYIFTEKYEKSIEYLEEAYRRTYNEDILLKIATIQINYLHNVDSAITSLENHRNSRGCSEKICSQLMAIYLQQNKINELVSIYDALFKKTDKLYYLEKLIELHLTNKEIEKAIEYVKKDERNYAILYSLYMENKDFTSAYELSKTLFQKTKDPKWVAESAISYYESLSDKNNKTELQKVISDFERSIKLGVKNPVYLNYYGYTLIDNDLDIKKGLEIVKKALKEEPANSYFLDSLAWGEYKLGNCNEAYPSMKKVVEIEGLDEAEIIEHWNAINSKCKIDFLQN